LALGKTVSELCEQLTSDELEDWLAFAREHLFPADLIDFHGAQLCTLLANINRSSTTPAFEERQFLASPWRRRRPEAELELGKSRTLSGAVSEARRIMAVMNGGG
jgi:hypothetical protein